MPFVTCAVLGYRKLFSVKIESDMQVSELVCEIKIAIPQALGSFDNANLILYKVDIEVPVSNDAARDEILENICQSAAVHTEDQKLHPLTELSNVFGEAGPLKHAINILVEPPTGTPTIPTHSVLQTFQPSPELGTVGDSITEFTGTLRPKIRDFLTKTKPRFTTWLPQAVDEKTRQFYSKLEIPLINGGPSLLFHNLGLTPNPNADKLFQGSKHQILCNTSGSGKTRLLFEGLCKHWGFYFVVAQGPDGIGARDLEGVITQMSRSRNWTPSIFQDSSTTPTALQRNECIAENRISKALLARWVIFNTFIQEARSIKEGGVLDNDVRRDWLLFQALPIVHYKGMDLFSALILTCLSCVSDNVLQSLQLKYSPWDVLGSAFDSTVSPFVYVLDEAQVAGEQYMGAFADTDGSIERPVLRPIVKCLSENFAKVIVSGTGFSLALFRTVLGSGVGKSPRPAWDVTHATGDFSNQGTQLDYISLYLPPSFLITPSGAHLKTRMYGWLRGRHRFTARYLEEVMSGTWEQDRPAAPHKLLNDYVNRLTDFTPLDGDQSILRTEPDVGPIEIIGFQWDKINRCPGLLVDLALGIHEFLTRGEFPVWTSDKAPLVEYGIARFVGEPPSNQESAELSVEEPLVLVGIMRHFERNGHPPEKRVRIYLQSNRGKAFEEAILLALTRMLQNQRDLENIFEFHDPVPPWAGSPAQIVTCNPSGEYEAFSSDRLSAPSSSVAFSAKTPQDVTRWLERGGAAWCIPCNAMGPDLMTRIQLRHGERLLLVVQAKSYTTGKPNVPAKVTAHAIQSLIPKKYFGAFRDQRRNNIGKQLEVEQSITTMLEATNLGSPSSTGALSNILCVVAAFPLDVNFNAKSKPIKAALKKDNLPLAKLSQVALTAELATCQDGKSLVEQFKSLKRTPAELEESSDEGPNVKRRRGKGN